MWDSTENERYVSQYTLLYQYLTQNISSTYSACLTMLHVTQCTNTNTDAAVIQTLWPCVGLSVVVNACVYVNIARYITFMHTRTVRYIFNVLHRVLVISIHTTLYHTIFVGNIDVNVRYKIPTDKCTLSMSGGKT